MTETPDLTVIYITANVIPEEFANTAREMLLEGIGGLPLISVSQRPMAFGHNINVGDSLRSHVNIYRQALIGADDATTKYIAIAEDDMLYSPAHFEYRPKTAPFAYNLAYWGVYTWQDPPVFNYKGRKNFGVLIADREAFIKAMEERFRAWPDETKVNIDHWAEPGKYERFLGVTPQHTEDFYTHPPNIKYSHENELSFAGLGTRKRAGELRATEIPYWGTIKKIRSYYA